MALSCPFSINHYLLLTTFNYTISLGRTANFFYIVFYVQTTFIYFQVGIDYVSSLSLFNCSSSSKDRYRQAGPGTHIVISSSKNSLTKLTFENHCLKV